MTRQVSDMDYIQLKQEVKEIVDIVKDIPEKFQEKSFEMLLDNLLNTLNPTTIKVPVEGSIGTNDTSEPSENKKVSNISKDSPIPLNAKLNVFLRRTGVSMENLNTILHYEAGNEAGRGKVHFVFKPDESVPVATGQIYWALLLGLKNNIESGSDFLVDAVELREICKSEGFYDSKNFATHLKNKKNYFKNPLESQGEPQQLADDGLTALAELIRTLVGQAK